MHTKVRQEKTVFKVMGKVSKFNGRQIRESRSEQEFCRD